MKKQLLLIALITFNVLHAQTKLLSAIQQDWNGSSWENYEGTNFEYDTNNNLITSSYYEWHNGAWRELGQAIYTYNSNNRVTQEAYKEFDSNTGTYKNYIRYTYTFNTNHNLTELLSEDWDGTQWINSEKQNVSYVDGNIDILIDQNWNGKVWVNYSRSTITNDSSNRVIQIIHENWQNNNWKLSDREIIERNANGIILKSNFEGWNGSAYVESYRIEYTLDSNGNIITETETRPEKQNIINYTYDNSQLMNAFAHPFADKTGMDFFIGGGSFSFHNKLLSIEIPDDTRIIIDYNNAITLNVNSFEVENKLIIYPNPVKTDLIIRAENPLNTIEIYNILGLKVMHTKNSTSINVAHLSKGIYTIKAIDHTGNTSIKKFIKK